MQSQDAVSKQAAFRDLKTLPSGSLTQCSVWLALGLVNHSSAPPASRCFVGVPLAL